MFMSLKVFGEFSGCTRAANSEVGGGVCLKFKLI